MADPPSADEISAISEKHPFLPSESELEKFVTAWRCGTLPKPCWTHAAHVGVAAYFAFEHDEERTFAILREGIRHYNTCVGTANTDHSGYHETLTGFWAREVGKLVRTGSFGSRLDAVRAAIAAFGDDRYRFRLFYSFDVVGSVHARREWIEPDLDPSAAADPTVRSSRDRL